MSAARSGATSPAQTQQRPKEVTSLVVQRGKKAWLSIKATEVKTKKWWLEVGAALKVGRELYPADRDFGAWCGQNFPGMDAPTRSDAQWAAGNGEVYRDGKPVHPKNARQEHRKAAKQAAPPEPDPVEEPEPDDFEAPESDTAHPVSVQQEMNQDWAVEFQLLVRSFRAHELKQGYYYQKGEDEQANQHHVAAAQCLEQILQTLLDEKGLKLTVSNLARFYNRHVF